MYNFSRESYSIDIHDDIRTPVVTHVSGCKHYSYGDAKASNQKLLDKYTTRSPGGSYAMTSDFCPLYIKSYAPETSYCDLIVPVPAFDEQGNITGEKNANPSLPCQYFGCGFSQIDCKNAQLHMLVIIDLFTSEVAVCCLSLKRNVDQLIHGFNMLAQHMRNAAPTGSRAILYMGRNALFRDKKVLAAIEGLPELIAYTAEQASNTVNGMIKSFYARYKQVCFDSYAARRDVWQTVANEIFVSLHAWNNVRISTGSRNINPAVTTRLFTFATESARIARQQELIRTEREALDSGACPVIKGERNSIDERPESPFISLLASSFYIEEEDTGVGAHVFIIIDDYTSELLAWQCASRLDAALITDTLKQLEQFKNYLPGCRIYTRTALPDPENPKDHDLYAELINSTELHEVLRDLGVRLYCSADYEKSGAIRAGGMRTQIKRYLGIPNRLTSGHVSKICSFMPEWMDIYNGNPDNGATAMRHAWEKARQMRRLLCPAAPAPAATASCKAVAAAPADTAPATSGKAIAAAPADTAPATSGKAVAAAPADTAPATSGKAVAASAAPDTAAPAAAAPADIAPAATATCKSASAKTATATAASANSADRKESSARKPAAAAAASPLTQEHGTSADADKADDYQAKEAMKISEADVDIITEEMMSRIFDRSEMPGCCNPSPAMKTVTFSSYDDDLDYDGILGPDYIRRASVSLSSGEQGYINNSFDYLVAARPLNVLLGSECHIQCSHGSTVTMVYFIDLFSLEVAFCSISSDQKENLTASCLTKIRERVPCEERTSVIFMPGRILDNAEFMTMAISAGYMNFSALSPDAASSAYSVLERFEEWLKGSPYFSCTAYASPEACIRRLCQLIFYYNAVEQNPDLEMDRPLPYRLEWQNNIAPCLFEFSYEDLRDSIERQNQEKAEIALFVQFEPVPCWPGSSYCMHTFPAFEYEDITLYACVIIDLFTFEIVVCMLSTELSEQLILETLKNHLKVRQFCACGINEMYLPKDAAPFHDSIATAMARSFTEYSFIDETAFEVFFSEVVEPVIEVFEASFKNYASAGRIDEIRLMLSQTKGVFQDHLGPAGRGCFEYNNCIAHLNLGIPPTMFREKWMDAIKY